MKSSRVNWISWPRLRCSPFYFPRFWTLTQFCRRRNPSDIKIRKRSRDTNYPTAEVLQDNNALQCDFRGSWKLKKRSGSTPALVFFSAWFAFVFWLLSALLAAAAIGIWLAQECFWPRCDQILPNYCLIWSQSQSYFCPHFGLISPLASSAVFSCRYPWLLSLVHFTTHLLQLDCSSLFILSALLTI